MQVNPHKVEMKLGMFKLVASWYISQGEHYFSNVDMDVGKDLVRGNVVMDHHVLVASDDIDMVDTDKGVVDVF